MKMKPRRSAVKVLLVTVLPILGCVLVFGLGVILHRSHMASRRDATNVMSRRVARSHEKRLAATQEASRALQAGTMTSEEWHKAMMREADEFARENTAAGEEWTSAGFPVWVQKVIFFSLNGSALLVLLILIFRGLWEVRGHQLHSELRRRGYDWLSASDALWLVLILPRRAWKAPQASDFLTLPGSSQDFDALIGFLKNKPEPSM